MSAHITIGTRGSDLALWQAHYTKDLLEKAGYTVSITIIKTQGDRIQHLSFDKMEGKGFFTKELEEALQDGSIDLAVHSYKDMPSEQPAGLMIAGISSRAHPADVLLVHPRAVDVCQSFGLMKGAVVGTSSARRKAQLLLLRPDVQLADIRGNVPTRIQKLRDGHFDAILLARAGMDRIGADVAGLQVHTFDPYMLIPAPAQGVLAYQIREDDLRLQEAVSLIHHRESEILNQLERHTLALSDGGCQIPLGVYAELSAGRFRLWAALAEHATAVPRRLVVQGSEVEVMAKRTVQLLRGPQIPCNVFISRTQEEDSLFSRLLGAWGMKVFGQSLVRITPIHVQDMPAADVVVCSSRNGARFSLPFLQQGNHQVVALGPGTAQVLLEGGVVPVFTGDGEATTVAKWLEEHHPNATILFPGATSSRLSVQAALPDTITSINWSVYENEPAPDAALPDCDIAVMTSPLNVQAYFQSPPKQLPRYFVAIGSPTAEALRTKGVESGVSYAASEMAMADTVISLMADLSWQGSAPNA